MKKYLIAGAAALMVLALLHLPKTGEELGLASIDSLAYDTCFHITLEIEGREFPITLAMRGEMTREPEVLHGRNRAGLRNAAGTMELYTETSGDSLFLYTGVRIGERIFWHKYREEKPELSLLDGAELMKLLGTTRQTGEGWTIDGTPGLAHQGEVTAGSLQKMLKAVMLLKGLEGEKAEELQRLLNRLDPETGIPFESILDPETLQLLELRVDLTDVVGELLAGAKTGNSLKIPEFTFRLTLQDHNAVGPIQIPREARTAS